MDDMIGREFERLTVIERDFSKRRVYWNCLCTCGKIKSIRDDSLKNNAIQSCGCLNKEKTKERCTTHRLSKTGVYNTWVSMIQRCTNHKSPNYCNYGGRGIKVCEQWLKFENFYKDMGKRPKGLTIDRIQNHLGYFKENCRWATQEVQSRNTRLFLTNSSGIKGVSLFKRDNNYRAYITKNDKQIHLGYFDTIKEAAEARKQAEIKYWGASCL